MLISQACLQWGGYASRLPSPCKAGMSHAGKGGGKLNNQGLSQRALKGYGIGLHYDKVGIKILATNL